MNIYLKQLENEPVELIYFNVHVIESLMYVKQT